MAANFIYGWMPRIAILNPAALNEALDAINVAQRSSEASENVVRAVSSYLGAEAADLEAILTRGYDVIPTRLRQIELVMFRASDSKSD